MKAPVLSSHQRQLSLQMSQVRRILIVFITFVLLIYSTILISGYQKSLRIKLSSCDHPPYIHVTLIVQVQEKQITNHHHHRHPHHHYHLVDRPPYIPPSHPPSTGAREANQEQNSADSD